MNGMFSLEGAVESLIIALKYNKFYILLLSCISIIGFISLPRMERYQKDLQRRQRENGLLNVMKE